MQLYQAQLVGRKLLYTEETDLHFQLLPPWSVAIRYQGGIFLQERDTDLWLSASRVHN